MQKDVLCQRNWVPVCSAPRQLEFFVGFGFFWFVFTCKNGNFEKRDRERRGEGGRDEGREQEGKKREESRRERKK